MFVVSTKMGEPEIDTLIASVTGALETLKPYIVEASPTLR